MLEKGEQILVGVTILMKAVNVNKAVIGIENNKPDAIAHLQKLAVNYKGIEIMPLKVQYPQGGEKQLIDAVVRRQVKSGSYLGGCRGTERRNCLCRLRGGTKEQTVVRACGDDHG